MLKPAQWVSRACAPAAHALPYLHVIDGVAYGTNGYRMHWAAVDLPDGAYVPYTIEPSARIPRPDINFIFAMPDFLKLTPVHPAESVEGHTYRCEDFVRFPLGPLVLKKYYTDATRNVNGLACYYDRYRLAGVHSTGGFVIAARRVS